MEAGVGSFRDPSGTCCLVNGRILRLLNAEDGKVVETFLATPVGRDFCSRQRLVKTRRLEPEEAAQFADVPAFAGRKTKCFAN